MLKDCRDQQKKQSRGKEHSRHFTKDSSFGRSQENVQQYSSKLSKSTEKHLICEMPEYKKLVDELLKAQSEYHEVCIKEKMAEGLSQRRKLALNKYIEVCKETIKQLNKSYDIAIENQDLEQIQKLFYIFSDISNNLKEIMKKLEENLNMYKENVEKKEKQIPAIKEQIEQMQKDSHAPNGKSLSYWVEASKGFLEVETLKETYGKYQGEIRSLEHLEAGISDYIKERNTFAQILGENIRERQNYEEDANKNDLLVRESAVEAAHIAGEMMGEVIVLENQKKVCQKALEAVSVYSSLDKNFIQNMQKLINLYDDHIVNSLKYLSIIDKCYKKSFLEFLEETRKNMKKDLKYEKDDIENIFNKYNELKKIGEEAKTKLNKLEGLIEQKRSRSTTSDRESHTSAESPVNTFEESGEANPNSDEAKKRDHLELFAQKLDDPKRKPIARIRRTSSENALAQRWQLEEGSLPDLLSKVEKQKKLWEDYCDFLKEEKASLTRREKSLREQIRLFLDKCQKQQECFQLFKQKSQELLQKAEKQMEKKSQERIEPESLNQLGARGAKKILERAEVHVKETYKEHAKTDPFLSAALTRIAEKVNSFLNQQGGDQHLPNAPNQPEQRELKPVIESKLQQFLERTLPLLDSARLKNDPIGYSKELEEDLIEKKLQKNKEQFEQLREEEKKISGDFSLRELTTDENIRYSDVIHAQFINDTRAHDGYLFYDHTVIVKYAELEKKEIYENIIRLIKRKYQLKENIINLNKINNNKLKYIIDIIDDKEAYETYQCVKRADAEKWKANADYNEVYKAYKECKDDYDKVETAWKKLAEASGIRDDATKRQALAEKQLEVVERKLRDHSELLIDAIQSEQNRMGPVVKELEEELYRAQEGLREAIKEKSVNNKIVNNKIETEKKLNNVKLYMDNLQKYCNTMIDLQKKREEYEEADKKIKKAEVLSDQIKSVIDEYKHLDTDQKMILEQIQTTKERLAEIKIYQNLKEELEQVQRQKEKISAAIDKASQELGKAKLQEEEVKELNTSKNKVELYQRWHRMEKNMLEMEEALKLKENEWPQIQDNLESVKNEIVQIKKDLKIKKAPQKDLQRNIKLSKGESSDKKLAKNKNDNLSQSGSINDKKIEKLASLQKRMEAIRDGLENCHSTITECLGERNKIAAIIGEDIRTRGFFQQVCRWTLENRGESSKNSYSDYKNDFMLEKAKISKEEIEEACKSIKSLSDDLNTCEERMDQLRPHLAFLLPQNDSNSNETEFQSIEKTCDTKQAYNDEILYKFNSYDKEYKLKRAESNKLAEQLKESMYQYDKVIIAGILFQDAAEKLHQSYMQERLKTERGFLDKITNKSNDSELQPNIKEINEKIANDERKLSSKEKERQSLQKNFDTIRLETKQLAEKIDEQKKEKEKLSDEIKALKLSEARTMRLKEKVANLELEKTVQLYNLAFHDTKGVRVSPTPAKTKGQETVAPEPPRAIQEAHGVGQQGDPLAPGEQEDDSQRFAEVSTSQNKGMRRRYRKFKPKPAVASESSSDDEFSILL